MCLVQSDPVLLQHVYWTDGGGEGKSAESQFEVSTFPFGQIKVEAAVTFLIFQLLMAKKWSLGNVMFFIIVIVYLVI